MAADDSLTLWIRSLAGEEVAVTVKNTATIEEAQYELWQAAKLPVGEFPEIVVKGKVVEPRVTVDTLVDPSYVVTTISDNDERYFDSRVTNYTNYIRMVGMYLRDHRTENYWQLCSSDRAPLWSIYATHLLTCALKGTSLYSFVIQVRLDRLNGVVDFFSCLRHTNIRFLNIENCFFREVSSLDIAAALSASAVSSVFVQQETREIEFLAQLQYDLLTTGIQIYTNGALVLDQGAVRKESLLIKTAFETPDLKNAKALKENHICTNITSARLAETLVHTYARAGHRKGLQILLGMGYRTDIPDGKGRLPVEVADEFVRDLFT